MAINCLNRELRRTNYKTNEKQLRFLKLDSRIVTLIRYQQHGDHSLTELINKIKQINFKSLRINAIVRVKVRIIKPIELK